MAWAFGKMNRDRGTGEFGPDQEYLALDRRERRIQWYMLASLFMGAFLGGIGGGVADAVPGWVLSIYDPYIFMALAVIVGWHAASIGWSLVNGTLAAFGSLVGQLISSVAVHGISPFEGLAGGASGLNILVVALVALGPLSYLGRRQDRWGVLATGMTAGVILGEAAEEIVQLVEGQPYQGWQAAVSTAALLALTVVAVFRRQALHRLWALTVAVTYSGSYGALVLAL
ncbi:hypothetical protein Aph01nite_26040 [Acrocarpospora phusangensis]|uniref:Uncharacterized protein n=1 Tax=Acrocarpospora phusangensis TaxID=1070424 RepID=A0A919QAS3_9ACTN|nr:hypothetical protein [Acrocarpospora phusangensis]GIH24294.1 hypothetical protein Aph01nite_26040 [Acrocarpospora phusangensis]